MLAANANLGLFGIRKLIDLRIPSGKPGVEGAQALERHVQSLEPDDVTLVTLPRVDRATQASAWFAALAGAGVTIAVSPLERAALPAWIAARLARKQAARRRATRSRSSPNAARATCSRARQEIEKLALLLPKGELAHEAVERAVADVARFDISRAVRSVARRRRRHATLRIIAALRGEGEPSRSPSGNSPRTCTRSPAFATRWRWASRRRRPCATPASGASARVRWSARRRVAPAPIDRLLHALARLDALAKGIGRGDAWDALVSLALELAGRPIPLDVVESTA